MRSKSISNINVLILFNSFWNYSGGDHFLIQLFKRIRSKFNNVYCISSEKGKTFIDQDVKNVNFITTNKIFDKLNVMIGYIFRTIQALSCLKLNSIDLIYASSDFFPDVLPAFIYKKFHHKTIWHQCIFLIYPSIKEVPGKKLKKIVARIIQKFSFLFIKYADIIVVLNSGDKERLIGRGFKPEKISVIMPGIDFNYISKISPLENYLCEGSFLGRLNHSKGIYDLVEIWRIVVNELPKAKLSIIGGGDAKIILNMNKEIIKAGLQNNIYIVGFRKNETALKIIKSSSLFIFPSHQESFGIVIAEAMACRVPVISWHLKVYDEVYRDTILKIPIGDINLFARKVVALLSDQGATEQMANKGFDFIKKYDWDNVAENYLKTVVKNLR